MQLLIAIFALSLVATVSMLLWKARQIKSGKLALNPSRRDVLAPVTVRALRKDAYRFTKTASHKALLWLTKWWAILTHLFVKFIREKVFKEETIERSPTLSAFLRNVSEYKARVRKIRERLEAHDKAREMMEEEELKNSSEQPPAQQQ